MNKAPSDVPGIAEWHHVRKRELGRREEEAPVSKEEKNMALARRFMEARVVKRDLDAVDEMLAPDFVNQNKLVPGQEPDREGYLRGIAEYQAALSLGRLIIEDQVAGGDKVVTRFIVHATHDQGNLWAWRLPEGI